ncbi:MAG: hypothetical protein ABSB66_15200 [Candidatus Acidiferrales bacterium]
MARVDTTVCVFATGASVITAKAITELRRKSTFAGFIGCFTDYTWLKGSAHPLRQTSSDKY